jgi:HPt (histidine-containing phosphotransfer) domain-containing protein
MSEPEVLDHAAIDALLESVGGDSEFFSELAGDYIDDSPRQFDAMRQALGRADCDEFRRAAHSLKSNSATLGAMTLSTMCRELEYMGRDGVLEGAEPRIAAAEAEFADVRSALLGAIGE